MGKNKNVKKIFINHHLGMGDCIVHNGMVRKISDEYPKCEIWVGAFSKYYDNVRYMYRDNKKINVIQGIGDNDINYHIHNSKYDILISSHMNRGHEFSYEKYFDDAFYLSVNMDPAVKKNNFYIKRDLKREKKVYQEKIIKQGINEYYFIHEKETVRINRNLLNPNIPIITADEGYGIFDYLLLMERAKECHFISSSFLSLSMCKKFNENTFAHMYCDRGFLAEYVKKNGIDVIL